MCRQLLSGLTPELRVFECAMSTRRVPAGVAVVERRTACQELLVVVYGRLRAVHVDSTEADTNAKGGPRDARSATAWELGRGGCLGDIVRCVGPCCDT